MKIWVSDSVSRIVNVTDEVDSQVAIIFKTSVSDSLVSSNPGVSMSMTGLEYPGSVNNRLACTLSVQDFRESLTLRWSPLTKLMN